MNRLFSLSLLVLGVLTTASVPALANDAGWVLTQKSANFGDQYLYISPSGMKCYNPRAGTAMVTKAPDWNVTLYNEKTRVYYQTTPDKWRQEIEAHGFRTDMASSAWARGAKSNICGLNATEYRMTGANTLHSGKKKSTNISGATYWCSDDIKVPPQLSQLLATVYGLPTTQSVPLRLTCVEKGANRTILETYRSQAAAIPVSYFEPPTGLTPVKSDAEVMMNDEQKQIINDMARELDDVNARPSSSQSTYSPSGAPTATTSGAAASGETINVGGLNLNKEKLQKFIEALKKKPQ